MRAYIIRRLLLIIPTLFILTILVFLSVRFIPGDVIDAMAGSIDSMQSDLDREAVERILGHTPRRREQHVGAEADPDQRRSRRMQ